MDTEGLKSRLLSASRIIFHRNSHLDDAAAQWFLRDIAGITCPFVFQDNGRISIDSSLNEIGLDVMHENAVKGYKLNDGGFSSVFTCLVDTFLAGDSDERAALEPLIRWIDTNDSRGSVTRAWLGEEHHDIEAVGLNYLFMGYKNQFGNAGDEVVNHRFGEAVLNPLYHLHLSLAKHRKDALLNCDFCLDFPVGICIGPIPQALVGWPQRHLKQMAQERGLKAPRILLYSDPGFGMGLLRLDDSTRLDDQRLQSVIRARSDDWFFHPGGFLAAHGTYTAPRSPDTSAFSVPELVRILKELYST